MSFNVEEFKKRFKERADAVKDRPMPPIGGDEKNVVHETSRT